MPNIKCFPILLFAAFFLVSYQSNAQKDTEFWFVAPELSQNPNNYDRPVSFWISTYGTAATITLSQPANASFPPQVLNLAANSSGQFLFPPLFNFVENTPANTILNKGFFIQSTAPITAYYEVISATITNPEIFSLKGRNALGELFYTPFQNLMANATGYSPLPHAAFDIVATEDNTTVNITPSRAIVGHAAGVPFTITLNRGQTYSAEAASQAALGHPAGSKVTADKPIAITIKDDLLDSGSLYGGLCRDLAGDQIVPVEKTGTRYIVQKGLLSTNEHVFIMGTQDATQVLFDGNPAGNINAGETLLLSVSGKHFIETSAAVYALQFTGNGCEVACALMPALDCSGSESVRFVRPTDEPFLLFLSTKTGNEGGFTLNGSGAPIPSGAFSVVPGSSGQFVAATIPINAAQIPTGTSSIVQNSLGLFQMGFLNGRESVTGCRYAFFSDFGNQVVIRDSISFCAGDSVTIQGITISESGIFEMAVPNPLGCDTLFQITANKIEITPVQQQISFCPGASITINGQSYTQPGTVSDTLAGSSGCDSVVVYTLTLLPHPTRSATLEFCPGDGVVIGGETYTQPGIVIDTIPGAGGCDTIVTYTLTLLPEPTRSATVEFCLGDGVVIGGETYTQPGIVIDTIPGAGGCDTIVTYTLTLLPEPTRSATIKFCPGESVVIAGQTYTQPGTVMDTISATVGCDTIVTYTLLSLLPAPSVLTIKCPDNISLIADPGTAPLVVNYNLPTAASDCPCPGLSLSLTSGSASGAAFPDGITQVCYNAQDSCGTTDSCCFTVTVREVQPCDVKINGCMRYELLSITADPGQNLTYRIRVINNCPEKLIYTAIQLPDGVIAMEPDQLSVFTAGSGREYDVRNPNYSPFYSIRFKSKADSIFGGQADIFKYTLPAQSTPTYMDITSRLVTQEYYEAHLNTFYCPIGITASGNRSESSGLELVKPWRIFPNPAASELWIDLPDDVGETVHWNILNSQGQRLISDLANTGSGLWRIDLPESMPNGLYFFELRYASGKVETLRFVVQR